MTLVCDTTALYAALDRRDAGHASCSRLLSGGVALVVPSPTLVEVDQLAHARNAPHATLALLDALGAGDFVLAAPDVDDHRRIRDLVDEYADLPLGYVDASVVAVAERLGADTVATLDRRHFSVVRPQHVEAFALVP